mgnify:CR=1 FL=1
MKKILIVLLLFIYPAITLFASSLNFTEEEKQFIKNSSKIKIGSMDSYIPFSFNRNGKKIGFTQDLINIISQKSGLKFEIVGGSWTSLYDMFLNSKIDMISEFSYKKNRLPFTIFSSQYYEIPIGIFTRNDFESYNGIETLKNKRVGTVKNSYTVDILRKENIEAVEFDSSNERFIALHEKKIDAVIANTMNMYKLESLMFSNIKLAGIFLHPDIKKEDLRFGIRKEKPLLASIINKTLDSIPFSVLSELKQNWILNLKISKSNDFLNEEEKNWIENNKITIGIEPAKPYIFFDNIKNKNDGLYNDILQKVIKNTGLEVEYIYSPWSRLLEKFKKQKIDLLPATFFAKDREKFGFFSNEYYKVREYIYVSAENNTIKNFKDLENKKIAITKGYSTIKKIKEMFPKIKIIETNGLDESTSRVINGEVDALVDYHLVVENYIRDNSIVGLKDIAQEDLKSVSVHFFSNIKKPILKSILQKGLDDISREEMNIILQKWVNTPYVSDEKQITFTLDEENFIKKHKKIRFGIRTQRAPFEFFENNEALGIAVDYVKKSAENVGLEVEFVYENISVSDSYNMLETREKFDTIPFTVKNKENIKRFSFGKAFLSYPMMIIKHKDSPYIGSMKDLVNKTIVLEKDYATNIWIKRDYPNIKIINVVDTKKALEYVNEGKVDAYVGNLAIANYSSVFGGLENLKVAAPSGYGNVNYNFVAPKEWPELTSILSKGFDQISSVEHSAIQQKWFSLQTIDKMNYSLIWKIVLIAFMIIIWVLWWNRKITIEKNKTKHALKELQSAQKKLEQKNLEVLESKNFLQSVLDESPNPIMIRNYEGTFLLANKAVAKLYHSTLEEMIGKNDNYLMNKEIKEIAQFFGKDIKKIIDKGKTEVLYEEFKDTTKREVKHYICTKKPFKNKKSEDLILIIANDISNIKRLEEEQNKQEQLLLNQSKIAAMGEMLGNISHQWRQPLSVITTHVSAINVWLDFDKDISNQDLRDCADSVLKQANYLSRTIDDFRNFFMSNSTEKKVYMLKDIFYKLENLIKIPFENNFIETVNDIDESIEVELNENILIQAFINIYNNSKDAFLEHNISTDDRYFFLSMKERENQVIMTFKDSAGGIKEGSMDKIFEPYFTTKHQSIGTGIGLYMTNQIITKHLKGTIEASNETYVYNGKTYTGAKFVIKLPLK